MMPREHRLPKAINEFLLPLRAVSAGKSYLIAKMAEQTASHGGEVLVLTHRRELLSQTGQLLIDNGIPARMAMIMTEANRLGQYRRPSLIITDEAHLSRAKSWMKVLDYYNTYTVGFTATPIRLDGKPLGDVYQDLICGVDARWLIDHDRLAPYEYYSTPVVSTDGLRVIGGDYVVADLEKLMDERKIYSDVLKSWETIAKGEQTIAYCVSVKHARETARMFTEAGYMAEEIDGATPQKERAEVMERFRRGETTILCNCSIISEGVSVDNVRCCLLLRPTESLALFWQQGMRCMRYLPGKTAKVIDCVANYTRNPLFDMPVEWSLTGSVDKPKRFNDAGQFTIRTCPKCYKVFPTADVCPYCGEVYPLTERELKAQEDIELERISQEEAEAAELKRKQMRMEVGRAKTIEDLIRIQKSRGYAPGWIWKMARVKGIKR